MAKIEYIKIKRVLGTCFYCEQENILLTKDHVIPSSRGGKNGWHNIVMSCKKCNGLKADNTPSEFLELLLNKPNKYYKKSSTLDIVIKNVSSLLTKEKGVKIYPKNIPVILPPPPKTKVVPFTYAKLSLNIVGKIDLTKKHW